MGTKVKPGAFDCYDNALPDEPMFVLLARDPIFFRLVSEWAQVRTVQIASGQRPASDYKMVEEARAIAIAGLEWRKANDGKWRTAK